VADYDAIIIGAGHNGLAAGAMLVKRGLRVVNLEKNRTSVLWADSSNDVRNVPIRKGSSSHHRPIQSLLGDYRIMHEPPSAGSVWPVT
jgi:thioredoxin reductase